MIGLIFVTTTACNFTCKHCLRGHAVAQHLPFPLVEKAVLGAARFGIDSIHLTGGEPFLYEHLDDVFSLAKKHKLSLTFSSNGTLFSQKWEALKAHREQIRLINISLDGPTAAIHDAIRGAGSFEKARDGMGRCRRLKVPFGVTSCLNDLNKDKLVEIVRLARKAGAGHVNFTTALPCARSVENALVLGREERRRLYFRIQGLARLVAKDSFRIFYVPVFIGETIFASGNIVMCPNQSLRSLTVDVDGSVHFCCFLTVYDVPQEVAQRLRICSLERVTFDEGLRMFHETIGRFVAQRRDAFNKELADDIDFSSCFYCNGKLGIAASCHG